MLFSNVREPPLRRRLSRAAQQLPTAVGLSKVYAALRKDPPATVLMYHSIPGPDAAMWVDPNVAHAPELFEQHLRYLARNCNVVPLERLLAMHQSEEPFARRTVALTFDDGYRDNLDIALPLLEKYQLPATFFLTNGLLDSRRSAWVDELYNAFLTRSRHELRLVEIGEDCCWTLTDPSQARRAHDRLKAYLIEASVNQRYEMLREVEAQLAPQGRPPRLIMTWDEVRKAARSPQVQLGAHTANHLDLTSHPERATPEVMQSIERIEQETGIACRTLAFPYNRSNQRVIDALKAETPLIGAVAGGNEPVVRRRTTDIFALPRLEGPRRMSTLRDWTSGAYPDLARSIFHRHWTDPN